MAFLPARFRRYRAFIPPALDAFLRTWRGSAGNERANFQSFLRDFCAALELPMPEPKGPGATYCFEKDLKLTHLDGSTTTGSMLRVKWLC